MEYFYSWGLLFVLPFTILAYIKSTKEERIKMIVSGIGFGIMAVIFDYMFLDYWKPKYLIENIHIEDFLYGFLFAGILTSMHNIFGKKMTGKFKINVKLIIMYVLILLAIFYLLVDILKWNYIYPLSITPLIIGIISYIIVKGNIKDVLITILCSTIITILVYNIILLIYPNAIDSHFLLENISGIKLIRVPIEEWLFAICIGAGATYTYEAVFGYK